MLPINSNHPSRRPLSIAFLIEGMQASGVDTSTQLLAAQLRKRGHRVALFVPWKENCRSSQAVDTHLLPALRVSPDQAVYWAWPWHLPIFEQFHKAHFDLIHVHTNTTINLLAWQLASLFHLPIVYTYHTMAVEYAHYLGPIYEHFGELVENTIERYDRLICDHANAVMTPSAKAASYLHNIGVQDVRIIPNGIDLRRFAPQPATYLRNRFGIPTDQKILLFVGRLNQEKRPLLAYDAFRRLQQQQVPACRTAHLVMVGEGALRHDLEAKIQADGLQRSVHLTGLVNYADMPLIYNSADVWLSTSCSEVHPMVAIESAACGLPAVAMADEALKGVIESGVNGVVVNRLDEMVAALQRLLADDAQRSQMSRQALQSVQRFRVETTAQQVEEVYLQILNGWSKRRPLPIWQRRHLSIPSLTKFHLAA